MAIPHSDNSWAILRNYSDNPPVTPTANENIPTADSDISHNTSHNNTSHIRRFTKNPLHQCRGYVVNIHNGVNYDIDLSGKDTATLLASSLYHSVNKSEYSYAERDNKFSDNSIQSNDNREEVVCSGWSYRCRLYGVGIQGSRRSKQEDLTKLKQRIVRDLTKRINLQQGWVDVKIYGVDDYQRRILVDIFDPITGENLSYLHNSNYYRKLYYTYNDEHRIPRV